VNMVFLSADPFLFFVYTGCSFRARVSMCFAIDDAAVVMTADVSFMDCLEAVYLFLGAIFTVISRPKTSNSPVK